MLLFACAAAPRPVAAADGNRGDARTAAGREAGNMLKVANFDEALDTALARRGTAANRLCGVKDAVARRILREYGAVFLAGEEVLPPPVCIFSNAESARRDYADTVRLWNSRLLPALEHWHGRGRLTAEDSERLRALPVREQVGAVLELERGGIFFSKDFSKSILYSVAAPGASQHLSLLAFDVTEYADERVRRVLARHGWFRTVRNDHPHFTYLGLPESLLPSRGLRRLTTAGGEFWVPNVYERAPVAAPAGRAQLAGLP